MSKENKQEMRVKINKALAYVKGDVDSSDTDLQEMLDCYAALDDFVSNDLVPKRNKLKQLISDNLDIDDTFIAVGATHTYKATCVRKEVEEIDVDGLLADASITLPAGVIETTKAFKKLAFNKARKDGSLDPLALGYIKATRKIVIDVKKTKNREVL